MRRKKQYYAYFFILPGCAVLLMFTIFAALLAFGFSFMEFNLLRPQDASFIGLENYIRLFQDESFHKALKNTLYFTVVVVPYQVTLAFSRISGFSALTIWVGMVIVGLSEAVKCFSIRKGSSTVPE